MRRLQRFLAIPMAASAVAALWLLWRQGGGAALVVGIVAALFLGSVLALVGLVERHGGRRAWAGAAPWSEAHVAADLQKRRPVFVYFTADWCLTCKVNEAAAIDRAEVRDAFKKADVGVFAGDWTDGDPAITRFLESRSRAGVPYYLWYAPGKPPEELPQLLTPSMLISRAQSVRQGR